MKRLYTLLGAFILLVATANSQECGVVYVTPNGATTGVAGTKTTPADLTYGITLLGPNATRMHVSTGTHNISTTITIPSNTTIEGGYNATNWTKSNAPETIVEKDDSDLLPPPYYGSVAFEALNASNFRLQDLTIRVTSSGTVSRLSLYGVHLSGCSSYDIVRCKIWTAEAGAGSSGGDGEDGLDGGDGLNGTEGDGDGGTWGVGGNGGTGGGANGGAGGAGATASAGNGGSGTAPTAGVRSGGGGGGGAAGGRHDDDGGTGGIGGGPNGATTTGGGGKGNYQGSFSCNDISNCNNDLSGNPGSNGAAGASGGVGTPGSAGTHANGYWNPGGLGSNGGDGEGGLGGRGGGGGGGEDSPLCDEGSGSGGGAGGGGGEGGTGGSGGSGGGSAYAIYVVNNGANGNVTDCELLPGLAGAGGTGGAGGIGGSGGSGGIGGSYDDGDIGCGGDGGDGGDGGNGGAGGAGDDGESDLIYEAGVPVSANGLSLIPGNPPYVTIDNPGCVGSVVTIEATTSGAWDFGSNATPTTATGAGPHEVIFSTIGEHDITFNGTVFSDFVQIYDAGVPSNSVSASATTVPEGCDVDFTTLAAGSAYAWDFGPNATPSTGNTQSVSDVSFTSSAQPITVYVTITTDCCGDVLDSIQINVTTFGLTLTASPGNVICEGDEVSFTVSESFTWYSFYANSSSVQNSASDTYAETNPQNGVSYTATAIDQNGCSLTSNEIVMQVEPVPVAELGSDQQACGQATVTLDAGSGFATYLWSTNETSQTVDVGPGTYWVEVGNGICTDVDSIEVTISAVLLPEISPTGDQVLCGGGTVTLDAGGGYASYLWAPNGETSQTITVSAAGSYSAYVTNAVGCDGYSDTVSVTTGANLTPQLSPSGNQTICDGNPVVLDAGSGYSSYLWAPNGETTQTISVSASGSYSAYVEDASGCDGFSDTVTVTLQNVADVVIAANGPLSICDGDSVILDAGSGYDTYLWSNGATTQTTTALVAGDYSVTGTLGGCAFASDTVTVDVSTIQFSITENGNILSVPTTYPSYQWFLNGSPIAGATGQTYEATESGNYMVEVTDANGCTGTSYTLEYTLPDGINDLNEVVPFIVYPNPSNGTFQLEMEVEVDYTVEIMNAIGQKVVADKQVNGNRTEINLESSGTYLIQVTVKEGVYHKKVVVE